MRWRLPALVIFALLIFVATIEAGTVRPPLPRSDHGISDIDLYERVADQLGEGRGYYLTATKSQRENDFPVQPFVTVRLPVLAWIMAVVGFRSALAAGILLVVVNVVIWLRALDFARPAEKVSMAALLALGSLMVPRCVYLHEWWAGLLVSAALGLFLLSPSPRWLLVAVPAMLVREFSALLLVAAIPILFWQGRRLELIVIALLLASYAMILSLHRAEVLAMVLPGDPVSPGWAGLRGLRGVSTDIQGMVLFDLMREPWGSLIALMPLLGWAEIASRRCALPVLWFGGFMVLLATAARPDNAFWVRMILPAYMVGLALVPRFLIQTFAPQYGSTAP